MRYTPITRPFKWAAELSSRIVRQDPVATTALPGRVQGLVLDLDGIYRAAMLNWARDAPPGPARRDARRRARSCSATGRCIRATLDLLPAASADGAPALALSRFGAAPQRLELPPTPPRLRHACAARSPRSDAAKVVRRSACPSDVPHDDAPAAADAPRGVGPRGAPRRRPHWGLAIVALTAAGAPGAASTGGAPGGRRGAGVPRTRRRSGRSAQRHREDATALRAELAAYRKQHGLRIARRDRRHRAPDPHGAGRSRCCCAATRPPGTFGDAGWLFIADLSEPAAGGALALLLGGWLAVQLAVAAPGRAARAAARRDRAAGAAAAAARRDADPGGVLLYLLVSAAFGLAQKLALRARAPVPALAASPA